MINDNAYNRVAYTHLRHFFEEAKDGTQRAAFNFLQTVRFLVSGRVSLEDLKDITPGDTRTPHPGPHRRIYRRTDLRLVGAPELDAASAVEASFRTAMGNRVETFPLLKEMFSLLRKKEKSETQQETIMHLASRIADKIHPALRADDLESRASDKIIHLHPRAAIKPATPSPP